MHEVDGSCRLHSAKQRLPKVFRELPETRWWFLEKNLKNYERSFQVLQITPTRQIPVPTYVGTRNVYDTVFMAMSTGLPKGQKMRQETLGRTKSWRKSNLPLGQLSHRALLKQRSMFLKEGGDFLKGPGKTRWKVEPRNLAVLMDRRDRCICFKKIIDRGYDWNEIEGRGEGRGGKRNQNLRCEYSTWWWCHICMNVPCLFSLLL